MVDNNMVVLYMEVIHVGSSSARYQWLSTVIRNIYIYIHSLLVRVFNIAFLYSPYADYTNKFGAKFGERQRPQG